MYVRPLIGRPPLSQAAEISASWQHYTYKYCRWLEAGVWSEGWYAGKPQPIFTSLVVCKCAAESTGCMCGGVYEILFNPEKIPEIILQF
jgi:hypothetical protein